MQTIGAVFLSFIVFFSLKAQRVSKNLIQISVLTLWFIYLALKQDFPHLKTIAVSVAAAVWGQRDVLKCFNCKLSSLIHNMDQYQLWSRDPVWPHSLFGLINLMPPHKAEGKYGKAKDWKKYMSEIQGFSDNHAFFF